MHALLQQLKGHLHVDNICSDARVNTVREELIYSQWHSAINTCAATEGLIIAVTERLIYSFTQGLMHVKPL